MLQNILTSAVTTHVSKSKPSKKSKPSMTPHARAKIHIRNRLRVAIHQSQEEWIDTCREATKAIKNTKIESWKDLLQDALSNSYGPYIRKVFQGPNGIPNANSPNEAMSYNGRTITNIKTKANIFVNHYARISKTQHV